MPEIKLITSDKQTIVVDNNSIQVFSSLIQRTLTERQGDSHSNPIELNLRLVSSETLAMVLKWIEHHKDDELDPNMIVKFENIPIWDRELLTLEKPEIFNIIQAAEILEIRILREYAFKMMFSMIPMKTGKGLRSFFNVKKNDEEDDDEQDDDEQDDDEQDDDEQDDDEQDDDDNSTNHNPIDDCDKGDGVETQIVLDKGISDADINDEETEANACDVIQCCTEES